jgi:hypothetical protein
VARGRAGAVGLVGPGRQTSQGHPAAARARVVGRARAVGADRIRRKVLSITD